MTGGIFSLIRAPAVAFLGGFLVVGGWIWAPQLSRLIPGVSAGPSSAGSGSSWFADVNRLGRPEASALARGCILRVLELDRDVRIEPGAAYSLLKAGSMQASLGTLLGKPGARSENWTVALAAKWGELASCIYAQDDREICDPDNRAAMVEATTKFFAFAKQATEARPAISGRDAQVIDSFRDRLLNALGNHRRYGTLVAADFGSFAPGEITQVMRGEPATRNICRR